MSGANMSVYCKDLCLWNCFVLLASFTWLVLHGASFIVFIYHKTFQFKLQHSFSSSWLHLSVCFSSLWSQNFYLFSIVFYEGKVEPYTCFFFLVVEDSYWIHYSCLLWNMVFKNIRKGCRRWIFEELLSTRVTIQVLHPFAVFMYASFLFHPLN